MEPKRVSNGGLSRILIAVVLVAFLLPMSGCTAPDDGFEVDTTISLFAPRVVKRDAEEIWDVTVRINKVTPRESVVKWSGVTVTIKDLSGSILLEKASLAKDTGSYGSTVEIWYINNASDEGTLDAGGVFKFTGLDKSYQGATIGIIYKERWIGDTRLPTDFL